MLTPRYSMSPRTQRFMRELDGDPDARRWKRVSAIISIAATACFVALLLVIGLYAPLASAQVSGPGACGARAVDNASFLTCDGDVLLIDIRGREDVRRTGLAGGSLVNIPFMDGDAPAWASPFNTRFLEDADAALRAARLTHEATVVLLCHSGALGELAAALMAEHGYERVHVVAGGENL